MVYNFEEEKKKVIEKKAKEQFDLIKIDEDTYLIAADVAYSNDIDFSFESNKLFMGDIKEELKQLNISDNDVISVCLVGGDNNKSIIEIVNISKELSYSMEINSELTPEIREQLVNYIAYGSERNGVGVTFYLCYNFEMLESVVE